MHVVLHIARKVEVDNSPHILYIKATRSNICSNHDRHPPILEVLQRPVPLVLVFVAVNCSAWRSPGQGPLKLVAHSLSRAENDDSCTRPLLADDILQQKVFCTRAVVDNVHNLSHVLVRHQAVGVANINNGWPVEELAGQPPNFLRPGSGEEERLASRGNASHDFADLRLEAHVKHAVRFVKDHVRNLGEVDLPSLKEIVEPSGRGDYDGAAISKITQLRPLGGATVHASRSHLNALSKLVCLLLDLGCQLAGRGKHEDGWPVPGVLSPTVQNVHKPRHQESQCFARTCLSHTNHVTTLQRCRPSLGLDDRRGFKARPRELLLEHIRKRHIGELEEGL